MAGQGSAAVQAGEGAIGMSFEPTDTYCSAIFHREVSQLLRRLRRHATRQSIDDERVPRTKNLLARLAEQFKLRWIPNAHNRMADGRIEPCRRLAQIEDENRLALANLKTMPREPLAKIGWLIMPANRPFKLHTQVPMILHLLSNCGIDVVA